MSFFYGLWKNNFVKFAVISVSVLLLFRYVIPMIFPFVIAVLFVMLFRPVLKALHKRIKVSEGILTGLLLGLIALLLLLSGWFALCKAMDLLGDLRRQGDELTICCRDALHNCCDFIGERMRIDSQSLEKRVLESAENVLSGIKSNLAPKALDASYSYAETIAKWVFNIVITVIAIILLTKDYESITERLKKYVLFQRIKETGTKMLTLMKIYLKAQCIIVLCVSVTAAAGLFACGVQRWYLWGILTGILDMLPFVGSGIVLLPVAVVSFLQGKIWSGAGCLIVYGICVFLRQILEPKLIGDKINMYPILVLLSVFFGIRFFSIGGIVLGPVSFFLIREIYEELKE